MLSLKRKNAEHKHFSLFIKFYFMCLIAAVSLMFSYNLVLLVLKTLQRARLSCMILMLEKHEVSPVLAFTFILD